MRIGMAGGTCTGKSTTAHLLADQLGRSVLSLDAYFHDPATFPRVFGHPDYDRYEAVDWARALEDAEEANGTVVVEGFLLLACEDLRDLLDVTFYVECDIDMLIQRRLTREPETIPEYITSHIRRRHEELVEPTAQHADHILDGSQDMTRILAAVVEELTRKGAAST